MMAASLVSVADGLWAAETGLRVYGFPITARMVVAGLPTGLWLHSPIGLHAIQPELDRLGPVAWRVAPNRVHHLFQAPYQQAYPHSRLAAPSSLAEKRPDLRIDHLLPVAHADWNGVLAAAHIPGNPVLDETVFLHRPSKTLILTDLAVHMGPWDHWATRLYARLNGCYGQLGVSYGLRMLFKDRKAARMAVQEVLDWPFDRIIPAHGPIIPTGGKDVLGQAFRWLLKA